MYIRRRKRYSQNFLHSRKLVNSLLGRSSIGKKDLVLDIGAGCGIITELLAAKAGFVWAIEIDKSLYRFLEHKFSGTGKLKLYHCDALKFCFPKANFKVFSNIPFSIEGKLIRSLIDNENPPDDCYLVIRKELAYRLSGLYGDNMFSIKHKPWFDFSIFYHFKHDDFSPKTKVEAVMWRFVKRRNPLLSNTCKKKFFKFVELGFGNGGCLFKNLKLFYRSKEINCVFRILQLSKSSKPSYVTLDKWIQLFNFLNK